MPLFEIDDSDELIPFRQLRGGLDLYEREIEDLLWENVEEFSGESLFPVARQPKGGAGGRPDVVALDETGSVVVVEIKRDVDRGQLAQCLEYAGWARTTSLDELARIYYRQAELDSGERYTMSFSREQGMAVGDFYILRGLLTYIADKRDPVMKDGEPNYRLRCIFSNGTESDLLMLSLARDLYRHGRRISRLGEARLGLEDATGVVYVLRSLSDDPEISQRRDLFKIGFSRRDVESRIQNAERDPTYLMAPVQLVETYEVNVNVSKLEHLLHVFFADARFEIEVVAENGTTHVTREWFDVPLEAIGEAVDLLVRGDILGYEYDSAQRRIATR